MSPTEFVSVYRAVRAQSLELTAHLSLEDMALQSMPDASPTKWHLAHTTWFFEVVALKKWHADYEGFNIAYAYLFNSYYEALGDRQPRPLRGILSRPALMDVLAYRERVDNALQDWLQKVSPSDWIQAQPLLVLGLHHEQQHQELIVTDMLHLLAQNPLLPTWSPPSIRRAQQSSVPLSSAPLAWLEHAGGVQMVGTNEQAGVFAFDNECPNHPVWIEPFAIANRLVNCGEYLTFMEDGGYERPEFWLSEGWARVQQDDWHAPLYWVSASDKRLDLCTETSQAQQGLASDWSVYGVHGLQTLQAHEAVTHLSFYEASAYAAWAGARLPTEFEWEVLAQAQQGAASSDNLQDLYGVAWQWTRSSYDPYPHFKPMTGEVAEYNGKFMVGQLVLRGSSAFTPLEPFAHTRATYRNFFPPAARWQCTGLRLAKDKSTL